ncbi:hypothetical protein [Magnetospirillum moscoviense]|uniref:Uncharacterized protein n=1 Tax=Magnetospirillum moscoviense TaxID=1437059 RepID=A0A178MYJ1_9PROT|nr:hypothetical protein [Magnetospirillum moscoviense]OAN55097.1 hypothetical protein A6A05_00620 [Magnetospirillum moscoviense]
MHRLRLLVFLSLLISTSAWAQRTWSPEELRELRAQEIEQWRREIPDYQMRLYARLQQVNQGQLQVQRLLVGGLVVILGLGSAAWWMLGRRIGQPHQSLSWWERGRTAHRRWRLTRRLSDLRARAHAQGIHDLDGEFDRLDQLMAPPVQPSRRRRSGIF